MPLREQSLCIGWVKSEIRAGESELSSQRSDVADCGDLTVNTVYIERAIDSLRRKGIPINEQLITHLSPLGWEHINLSGDYVWRTNLKLGQGKYRALCSVNSNMYKKQA
jgi:hypothetical protein